jgi:hypothetical protein
MVLLLILLKLRLLINSINAGAEATMVLINRIKIAIKGIITIIIPKNMVTDLNFRYGSILLEIGRMAYANIAPKIIILSIGVNTKAERTTRIKITKIADVTVLLRLSIIFSLLLGIKLGTCYNHFKYCFNLLKNIN